MFFDNAKFFFFFQSENSCRLKPISTGNILSALIRWMDLRILIAWCQLDQFLQYIGNKRREIQLWLMLCNQGGN